MNLDDYTEVKRTKALVYGPPFSPDWLRKWYDYEPSTGKFTHKHANRRLNITAGQQAGYIEDGKYRRTKIEGKLYPVHTLIWYWVTGDWLIELIDHEDRNGLNNIWTNLRKATKSQNQMNRINKRTTARNGLAGVRFRPHVNRYEVTFRSKYLASAGTLFEAACIRKSAEANWRL